MAASQSYVLEALVPSYLPPVDAFALLASQKGYAADSARGRRTVLETLREQTRIEASSWLSCACAASSFFSRLLACKLIQRFFKARRQRLWLDVVAQSVALLHAFPNRLSTNFSPWREHFSGGTAAVLRMRRTKRFTPRAPSRFFCPQCRHQAICSAIYFRVGTGARSFPAMHVGCSSCCEEYVEQEVTHADESSDFRQWRLGEPSWGRICASAVWGSW